MYAYVNIKTYIYAYALVHIDAEICVLIYVDVNVYKTLQPKACAHELVAAQTKNGETNCGNGSVYMCTPHS